MTTPEGKVKAYLKQRVEALGGQLRFVKFIGRRNCPDTRVTFPPYVRFSWSPSGSGNCWVETKAGEDGRLSGGQVREIARMQNMGEIVLVLNSKEAIDERFPAP